MFKTFIKKLSIVLLTVICLLPSFNIYAEVPTLQGYSISVDTLKPNIKKYISALRLEEQEDTSYALYVNNTYVASKGAGDLNFTYNPISSATIGMSFDLASGTVDFTSTELVYDDFKSRVSFTSSAEDDTVIATFYPNTSTLSGAVSVAASPNAGVYSFGTFSANLGGKSYSFDVTLDSNDSKAYIIPNSGSVLTFDIASDKITRTIFFEFFVNQHPLEMQYVEKASLAKYPFEGEGTNAQNVLYSDSDFEKAVAGEEIELINSKTNEKVRIKLQPTIHLSTRVSGGEVGTGTWSDTEGEIVVVCQWWQNDSRCAEVRNSVGEDNRYFAIYGESSTYPTYKQGLVTVEVGEEKHLYDEKDWEETGSTYPSVASTAKIQYSSRTANWSDYDAWSTASPPSYACADGCDYKTGTQYRYKTRTWSDYDTWSTASPPSYACADGCDYKERTGSNPECGTSNYSCRTSACGVESVTYKSCANSACGAKTCATSACGYNSCTNVACGYKSCATSACGYNSCANSACGYNSCVNSSCTCKTWKTCVSANCGNKTCQNRACGCAVWNTLLGVKTTCKTYATCANSACGYKSCATSSCGCSQFNSCTNANCGAKTCATSACGTKTCVNEACGAKTCTCAACGAKTCTHSDCGYNSCRTSACGVESQTYKSCSNSACGTYYNTCTSRSYRYASWNGWSQWYDPGEPDYAATAVANLGSSNVQKETRDVRAYRYASWNGWSQWYDPGEPDYADTAISWLGSSNVQKETRSVRSYRYFKGWSAWSAWNTTSSSKDPDTQDIQYKYRYNLGYQGREQKTFAWIEKDTSNPIGKLENQTSLNIIAKQQKITNDVLLNWASQNTEKYEDTGYVRYIDAYENKANAPAKITQDAEEKFIRKSIFIPYFYITNHWRKVSKNTELPGYDNDSAQLLTTVTHNENTSQPDVTLEPYDIKKTRSTRVIYFDYHNPLSNYENELPENWKGYEHLLEEIRNTNLDEYIIEAELSKQDLNDMREYLMNGGYNDNDCEMLRKFAYVFKTVDGDLSDFLNGHSGCKVED